MPGPFGCLGSLIEQRLAGVGYCRCHRLYRDPVVLPAAIVALAHLLGRLLADGLALHLSKLRGSVAAQS